MKGFNNRKNCLILTIFALAFLWSAADTSADDIGQEPKRVLAIFVFKQGLPWAYRVEESLRAAVASQSNIPIVLDVEHADQSRFPEEEYRAKIIDFYRYKYSKQKVDLVLAMGDEAADLLLEHGNKLFGDIPVVLITTKHKKIDPDLLKPKMIPMVWGFDFKKTGKLIVDLLPKTKNIFVVSGTALTDQKLQTLAIEGFAGLGKNVTINYLDDYSREALLVKITQLPEDSVIFFLSFFRDANGQSFVPRDILDEVTRHANVPTFGIVDLYLGHGIVGGNLLSADEQGKRYAEIAGKILSGDLLTNTDFIKNDNQVMVDSQQLKRWDISEQRLPTGSIVRNRQPSLWADHKWQIVGGIFIIFAQAFALIGFFLQHRWRKRAEEQTQKLQDELAHVSRVQAMGEIAASLAHEINQPLAAIRSYAQAAQRFLANDPAEPDEASKSLTGVIAGNRRAEEVVKRIRMALKKEPFQRSPIDINELTQEVIMLLQNTASDNNVSLELKLGDGLPLVFGDSIMLQQVVFNLIINGIEAMIEKESRDCQVTVQTFRGKSDAVTVSVRDNGGGIDEKEMPTLFEAFYTTKTEGMGMGLSISRSIIEDHGGQLWATCNHDLGTTFSFTVPIYEELPK